MLRQLDQALSIARSEAGAAIQGMVSVGLPATTVSAIGLPLVRRIRRCETRKDRVLGITPTYRIAL